jgi:ABC-2 type transport system ATP-binding protein
MDTSEKQVIRVDQLSRRFGDFIAVDRLSFTLEKGAVVGLLGANGAGKTTAIRMMTGLLKPSSGGLIVAGVDVARHPRELRSRIGYVSQKFSLYGDLTAIENLRFYAGIYGFDRRTWKGRVDELLQQFPLGGDLGALTRDLPMGVRQRLGVLCAVIHHPAVLFLDEPTSGVDPLTRREIWLLIHRLALQGIAVVVTTHAMEEAEFCDRLLIMHRGQLVAAGSIDQLKSMFNGRGIRQIFREVTRT